MRTLPATRLRGRRRAGAPSSGAEIPPPSLSARSQPPRWPSGTCSPTRHHAACTRSGPTRSSGVSDNSCGCRLVAAEGEVVRPRLVECRAPAEHACREGGRDREQRRGLPGHVVLPIGRPAAIGGARHVPAGCLAGVHDFQGFRHSSQALLVRSSDRVGGFVTLRPSRRARHRPGARRWGPLFGASQIRTKAEVDAQRPRCEASSYDPHGTPRGSNPT